MYKSIRNLVFWALDSHKCYMGGGDAPEAPDPYKVAGASSSENRNTFNYQTGQNRYDVTNPFGSTTWQNTPTFDETGYNTALDAWNAKNGKGTWTPEVAGHYSSGGGDAGQEWVQSIPGSWSGGSSDGSPMPTKDKFTNSKWSSTSTLDPKYQAILDSQTGIQQDWLSALTGMMPGAISSLQATPDDYNPTMINPEKLGLSSWTSADHKMGTLGAGDLPSYGELGDNYKLGSVSAGPINRGSLDFSVNDPTAMIRDWAMQSGGPNNRDWASLLGSGVMGTAGDLRNMGTGDQYSQQGADAAYGAATRYMDPQFEQQQRSMESRLGEQGFVPGTPAYNQAMQEFMNTKNQAYGQAKDQALLTGHQWGQDFTGNQRNSLNDSLAALMGMGNLGLSSDAALNKGALDFSTLGLASDQARSGENQAIANFGLNKAQFGTGLQNQDFNQQKILSDIQRQGGLDANNVIQQQFGLDNTRNNANNSTRQQTFDDLLKQIGFNNTAAQTDNENDLKVANFNKDATIANNQSQFNATNANNASTLNATNLNNENKYAAFNNFIKAMGLTGDNPAGMLPSIGGGSSGANLDPTNLAQLFQNQFQGQQGNYNAGVNSDNQTMAAIAGIIAAFASDRRVKENIKQNGRSPLGYPWYTFNYIGDPTPRSGVMAQEVQALDPSAVVEKNGILHVDYRKV